jgi:hypothetical protein
MREDLDGSLQCSASKAPENKHRGGEHRNEHTDKSSHHKTLLPGLPTKAWCQDWRHGPGTEHRSEHGEQPIHIGAVERGPVRYRLCAWPQSHLAPDGTQRDQKDAVRQAHQVRGKPHAHIGNSGLDKGREHPQQKQKHAMPHQVSVAGCHAGRLLMMAHPSRPIVHKELRKYDSPVPIRVPNTAPAQVVQT